MERIKINETANPDGYQWAVFKFPAQVPHHIDVLVSDKGLLVGWVRMNKQFKTAEAIVSPESLGKGDNINLLKDGQWLGLYPNRLIAADTVFQYVKHMRS